jgi:hypothetical protein
VEAEDIDLGNIEQDSGAFNVGGDIHPPDDNDPEALDSENEGELDDELGVDIDESDCTC